MAEIILGVAVPHCGVLDRLEAAPSVRYQVPAWLGR